MPIQKYFDEASQTWKAVDSGAINDGVNKFTPQNIKDFQDQTTSQLADIAKPNVLLNGAKNDGSSDISTVIPNMVAAGIKEFVFPDGTYLVTNPIKIIGDNITVDFGNAKIIVNLSVGGYAFTFGETSNTPLYTELKVKGGFFELSNPATTLNINFLKVCGTKNFLIENPSMRNVSNGGIQIEAGCEDGRIVKPIIEGKSGYSTCRGIWLNGSTSSDFALQLIDEATLTRNANPLPLYAVKNVKIESPIVKLSAYGIYLMNTRDCEISDPNSDISGATPLRCIALNNYSPRAIVKGGTLTSNSSSTGILITQFSHDVTISGVTTKGTFGGNRDVYLQYLSDAYIDNCKFLSDSNKHIQINTGAGAEIGNNIHSAPTFSNGKFAVMANTIDTSINPSMGSSSTILKGITFKDNVVKNLYGVRVDCSASTNGNISGYQHIIVENNKMYNADLFTGGDGTIMALYSEAITHKTKWVCKGNKVFPESFSYKTKPLIYGVGLTQLEAEMLTASFEVGYTHSTTSVYSTKIHGDFMSCSTTRSADDFVLSPRTNGGNAGSTVARIMGITPISTNIRSWRITASGTNYMVKLYDDTGTQIPLNADIKFYVHITGSY